MVPVFNDGDIIKEVLEHLISQGIEPVVLDNGSTDGSFEICQEFFNKGLIGLQRYESNKFLLMEILRKLYDMALVKSPDWLIINGSDEFLESGQNDSTLKTAISKIDSEGYNLIQFNVFNFFMTENNQNSEKSVKEKMKYYSFDHDDNYRAWKFHPGISPELKGGHSPIFPSDLKYQICPTKFVLRHYRFRSKEQADRKMKERLIRNKGTAETRTGWHNYWKVAQQNFSESVDHSTLNKYQEDNNWNLERRLSISDKHKTREEIFSEDGSLKDSFPSYADLKLNIITKNKKIENLERKLNEIEDSKSN